jgi:putative PEP-CTERM system TPR-repeat lipoprotein
MIKHNDSAAIMFTDRSVMTRSRRLLWPLVMILCVLQFAACGLFIDADTHIARAEKLINKGDDRGALIEVQSAVRREPGNVRALLLLSQLSLRLGDPKAAKQEAEAAAAAGATPAQTAPLLADAMLALGEARALLDAIEGGKAALDEPARSTYRGLALLQAKDFTAAISAFDEALAKDPRWERAHIGLAEARAASGESEAALAALDKVLTANPENATALVVRGNVLLGRGEFPAAVTALSSAREHAAGQLSNAQYASLLAALTEAHLGAGEVDKAQATHGALAKILPGNPITGLLAARLAMARQDYAAAVAEAQKVVNSAPQLLPARMLLGVALLAQGNLNQSEIQLAQVVQLAPENTEARKLLARVNLQLNRPDVALQVISPLQQEAGADAQLDSLLGLANLQLGDADVGLARLESSVAKQPTNTAAKVDLAAAYVFAGQNERARQVLEAVAPGDIRRDTLLVRVLAATAGPEAARAQIDRMVSARPNDAAVVTQAALLYASQREFDKGRALLAKLTTSQPTNADALIALARIEGTAGDNAAARQAAQRAVTADPANIQARLLLANLAVRSGEVDAAIGHLEEARKQNTTAVEPRLSLARLYLQQRRTRDLDAIIAELERMARDNGGLANALGQLFMEAGRFEAALEWFRTAATQNPGSPAPLLDVTRAQLAMGNTTGARETLQKLLAAHPQHLLAAAQLVMLDIREQRRDAAMERLASLKAAYPNEASVALLEGEVAMATGSYSAAATAFDHAYKLTPSSAAAIRAYRARRQGRLPRATDSLIAWLQERPDDVGTRLVLAEEYMSTAQSDRAIEQYQLAASAVPPNPTALNNLAWLYHEKGDARAEETAKRAYDAAPKAASIADTYGWILVQKGRIKEGLPILQQAAAATDQPQIGYHYAAALAKAGQSDAARKALNELLRNAEKHPVAEQARRLLSELGG